MHTQSHPQMNRLSTMTLIVFQRLLAFPSPRAKQNVPGGDRKRLRSIISRFQHINPYYTSITGKQHQPLFQLSFRDKSTVQGRLYEAFTRSSPTLPQMKDFG